ncbi:Na+ dependent nucleoside transporter C-terminus-domain-containing protein [Hygrophoropsis aurantiaca]|uniref:Na+ dependent nucleoside transporter C-terminus-domain-containing protein n=1 Tax=Hygrophoropsis aurantiaca TaxID=72124 RepID=A0ACB8AP10_9AGAM|nr:Na+ dependent nucleoside transporter C-terminus-domain-containing protein [Hygrophoropsis aurantiaca]
MADRQSSTNVLTDSSHQVLTHRQNSPSDSVDVKEKKSLEDARVHEVDSEADERHSLLRKKIRVAVLIGLAVLILAWWISATVLLETRGRWLVQTIFAWFFLLVIAFRFIPNSVVTRPISAIWMPFVEEPWYRIPRTIRMMIGWLCLLAVVFGSAFGFALTGNTDYAHRAISVLGLFVFQASFWLTSTNRSAVCWPTVIVGLVFQQVVALFVLKTGAGYHLFKYIADLAYDFLTQAYVGAEFFFDADTIGKHWFFVNTLAVIIFFIAFVQMMYYIGVMQWVIKGFAWFFFKAMNISGAEAVVASASPWVGQGESACLVKPYVDLMTRSELHLVMTSGFSTISGAVLSAYVAMGVPPQNLVTSSVMSIPASIAISKMRMPEVDEPVTRGQVIIDRGKEDEKRQPVNVLHAFAQGGVFGLNVAGQILTNVLIILSLVATINGVLTWVGRGFGIRALTLQLVLGYIGYPIAFLLGVPYPEIFKVSQLLATKLIENEFSAYLQLKAIQASSEPLSERAFTIASYSLCGFANLSSLGIQIGVLSALAPNQAKTIAKIATSAMICGFISTLQTAGIAGMLV